jgi:serine/threonine-protein kinase
MPPLPKTIGRYDILELVGRGGMGVLYRAHDPMLERDVALKTMLVDFTFDPAARERFEREAKAVARLQHRNVVTIHELGETDGAPYIVMEFLGGQDLDAWLRTDPPRPLAQKLDVVIQLLEGLAYAHEQGIVHRDIKPGNVRVLDDGTVKILDFGIAKFAKSSVTQTGTMMGTASYMAPEQIMGQAVDGRADVFSAGVLLHEIVSGQKPFNGDTPTAVVYQIMHVEPPPVQAGQPDLPEALGETVARALAKDPDERYQRASEMAADLQMVRLTIDLPLTTGAPEPGAPDATLLRSARLHASATPGRPPTSPPAVVNAPLHPGAAKTPVSAPPAGGRMGLFVGAGAAVLVVLVAGLLSMRTGGRTVPAEGAAPAPVTATPGGSDGAPSPAGQIVIVSTPAGAAISVAGADTGLVTPAPVPVRGSGGAAIVLSLQGYRPLTATLTEADIQAGRREFRLARDAGPVKLTMTGSFPFEIVQGDKVVSPLARTHAVTLEPGGGAVTVRNPEVLLKQTVPVDFQRASATVTLPAPGVLPVFSAMETCTVLIDGIDVGFPPIAAKTIAAGAHTVTLKCPDGTEQSQPVTIGAGERHAPITFRPQS